MANGDGITSWWVIKDCYCNGSTLDSKPNNVGSIPALFVERQVADCKAKSSKIPR